MNSRQLSFIITFFSMGLLVVSLFVIKLQSNPLLDDTYEVVLEEELLEQLEEELARAEESGPTERIRSHRVFNEDLNDPIEEPEPIRSAEEILEELKAEQAAEEPLTENDGYSDYLEELARQRRERAKKLEESQKKEEKRPERPSYAKDRNTSVYFSLVGREPRYDIPLPIYTCIEGGKVVVNIKVDREGYVTEARYNAKASTTSNGCLVDNALEYAQRARFSASDKSEQPGTITYLFERK